MSQLEETPENNNNNNELKNSRQSPKIECDQKLCYALETCENCLLPIEQDQRQLVPFTESVPDLSEPFPTLPQHTDGSKTVVLSMIVRNEAPRMRRMLNSCLGIIDAFVICDTGSTDNTAEVIREWAHENKIIGRVFFAPFVDFSTSRNVALRACDNLADYVLLLDADLRLEYGALFSRRDLLNSGCDTYLLSQTHNEDFWSNARFVRGDGSFKYKCPTHEYVCRLENLQNNLGHISRNELFIQDVNDGGSKSNKYSRDISLLENALADSSRNVFYLANSYYWCWSSQGSCNVAMAQRALDLYETRYTMGHYYQEKFVSMLHATNICLHLGRTREAEECARKACSVDVTRSAEVLWLLCNFYRQQQNSQRTAYKYYEQAITMMNLQGKMIENEAWLVEKLMLDAGVYKWKFAFEHSILAYYVKESNVADSIVKVMNYASEHEYNHALKVASFYPSELNLSVVCKDTFVVGGSKQHIVPRYDLSPDVSKSELQSFRSSSLCLLPMYNQTASSSKLAGGGPIYIGNLRWHNYTLDKDGVYHSQFGYILTLNERVTFTKYFSQSSSDWFEPPVAPKDYSILVIGEEDVRLRYAQKQASNSSDQTRKIEFFASRDVQNNRSLHSRTIGVCHGDYSVSESPETNHNAKMADSEEYPGVLVGKDISSPHNRSCEKNWCFVDSTGVWSSDVVYEWGPAVQIYSLDKEGSALRREYSIEVPGFFRFARGGSSGCPVLSTKELWFVVHFVVIESGMRRVYWHAIVVFDWLMTKMIRHTAPFRFNFEENIQYCLSIIVEDDRVIMPYSAADSETRISVYERSEIEKRLCFAGL